MRILFEFKEVSKIKVMMKIWGICWQKSWWLEYSFKKNVENDVKELDGEDSSELAG